MNKMMMKALTGAVLFIVLIPLGLSAQDEGFYPYSFARLSYVSGSVYVQRTSDLGYEKGEVNLALVQGDKMGTESGQAEVHFGRRNYLRIDSNTKVEFAVLPTEGDERVKLHLTEGSAYLRISHLAVDKGVEVHTPDASFYVLEEGLYRFDVSLDRDTRAFVREGSLEAASEDGSVLVREQETVTAAAGRLLGDPEYGYLRQDGFDDWNGSRDAQFAQRSERQYVPSEIEEYQEELDQNGHWVYERPYGNVWVPNVYDDGWRPYLYGRWVWYPVIGWNWVSSEPWGWSVYHYGRWHWRFGLGWYWIPRHHWGPAWVHWWWDRDHVGWCPLSWYNRPAYVINNRFYDRYDDRYFSAHNRAMTVIRRDHLQSPEIARRQLGPNELGRISRVELRAEQPKIRPAVDNMRPQALAAKRALAARPGARNEVRSLAPSNSLSSSRLKQGGASPGARTRDGQTSLAAPGRNGIVRPSVKGTDPGSRAIRAYPSRRLEGRRDEDGAPVSRRGAVSSPSRERSSENRGAAPRVSSPDRKAPTARGSESGRTVERVRKPDEGSKSGVARKSETIKNYPSSARAASTSVSSRTFSGSARASSARPSVRAKEPAYSSRPSVSRPSSSSRSGSSSYARPGSSRSSSSSSSRPRSSFSAPSRSGGSSGRSFSAPRPSGSSSGRSVSAPRSGGSSSSGRSSSSSRSGSSSSKSSSSSSKSGGVRKKG